MFYSSRMVTRLNLKMNFWWRFPLSGYFCLLTFSARIERQSMLWIEAIRSNYPPAPRPLPCHNVGLPSSLPLILGNQSQLLLQLVTQHLTLLPKLFDLMSNYMSNYVTHRCDVLLSEVTADRQTLVRTSAKQCLQLGDGSAGPDIR